MFDLYFLVNHLLPFPLRRMKKLVLTIVMSAVGISAYASPSPLSEKFVVFKKPDYAQQIVSNHHTVQNVVIKECKGTEWGILNDKLDDQGYICLGWSDFEKWNAHGLVTQEEIIKFSKSIGAVYVTYIATPTRNNLATFYNLFFFAYGPDYDHPKVH
jgi:hypothetical protein